MPNPAHYEQAVSLVTEDHIAEVVVCSADPEAHVEAVHKADDAGYDHIHIDQIGPDQEGFFRFYEREVLPRLRA